MEGEEIGKEALATINNIIANSCEKRLNQLTDQSIEKFASHLFSSIENIQAGIKKQLKNHPNRPLKQNSLLEHWENKNEEPKKDIGLNHFTQKAAETLYIAHSMVPRLIDIHNNAKEFVNTTNSLANSEEVLEHFEMRYLNERLPLMERELISATIKDVMDNHNYTLENKLELKHKSADKASSMDSDTLKNLAKEPEKDQNKKKHLKNIPDKKKNMGNRNSPKLK